MTNLRNISAVAAAAFGLVVTHCIFAQDDLDDLLKDLEGKPAEKAQEAAPQPAAQVAEETAAKPQAEAPAQEVAVEQVAAPAETQVAQKVEEVPAQEAVASEPLVEKAPEAVATQVVQASEEPTPKVEEVAATEVKAEANSAEAVISLLDELKNEGEQVKAEPEEKVAAPQVAAKEPKSPVSVASQAAPVSSSVQIVDGGADAELLRNIYETEKQRRDAFDAQAKREVEAARQAMFKEQYADAIRHYVNAQQFLNDSPRMKSFLTEADQGIAEGLFRYAIEEDRVGRREKAIKLMEKAVDYRHPKARRQLEVWLNADDPDAYKTDISEIKHRQNDDDYKKMRDEQRAHLRRARQFLATYEIEKALVECEIVLKADPYNKEALAVRQSILKKRGVILKKEREITRKGMIDDVDEKWRPVYAPNARQLEEVESKTIKKILGADDERSPEQVLTKRMQDMILPTVEFKPPATISDAVDFFRDAARDYDNPEIPIEKRGFGMILRTPKQMFAQTATDDGGSDDFSDEGNDTQETAQTQGLPVIPNIAVNNISFYEALKLVCESVGYKFKVQGSIVTVMEKSMTSDEMVTRSYPVLASFLDKMGNAASEMREMQAAGAFGGGTKKNDEGEENQERDWKEFFRMMGVDWPEGSSIFYLKTLGKLRVKNTRDNLVDFEDALNELNVDQRLIEIETRFVEVCQDDLNSLGFEWLLNSDYTLGVNRKLGRILGLQNGAWGERTSSTQLTQSETTGQTTLNGSTLTKFDGQNTTTINNNSTIYNGQFAGNRWTTGEGGGRNMGINAINGTDYSNGNRYLSTVGNHISGQSNSNNDQFMRVNAFLGSADVSMILHMLSQRSDTDLLSSPKVLTRPGEEAIIKVVTEYIYPTDYDVQLSSSSSGSSGYGSSSSGNSSVLAIVEPQSFSTREVGVILDVTPTLTDDGNLIDLELDTQVVDEPTWKNYGMKIPYSGNSSLTSFQGLGEIFGGLASIFSVLGSAISPDLKQSMAQQATDSATAAMQSLSNTDGNMTYYDVPMEQPFFHTRQINTKVSVYPGATIVMGGLITEARKAMDDKIPFLGDIPIIGRFFRSHSELTSKRNLLIFVTTRLVDTRGREVEINAEDKTNAEVKAAPELSAEVE